LDYIFKELYVAGADGRENMDFSKVRKYL